MDDAKAKQPEIEADPNANWPNTVRTREELDAALEAGLKSGVSPLSHDEIIAEAKRELGVE